MNEQKNLEGFFDALGDQIEGASLLIGNPTAFLAATQAIEELLVEEWPALKKGLQSDGLSADGRKSLLKLLESINALETKTRARLAWSEDFEAHMRRAMETTS